MKNQPLFLIAFTLACAVIFSACTAHTSAEKNAAAEPAKSASTTPEKPAQAVPVGVPAKAVPVNAPAEKSENVARKPAPAVPVKEVTAEKKSEKKIGVRVASWDESDAFKNLYFKAGDNFKPFNVYKRLFANRYEIPAEENAIEIFRKTGDEFKSLTRINLLNHGECALLFLSGYNPETAPEHVLLVSLDDKDFPQGSVAVFNFSGKTLGGSIAVKETDNGKNSEEKTLFYLEPGTHSVSKPAESTGQVAQLKIIAEPNEGENAGDPVFSGDFVVSKNMRYCIFSLPPEDAENPVPNFIMIKIR